MNDLLTIILLCFVAYMLFFRKGGVGCCGCHRHHKAGEPNGDDFAVDKKISPWTEENIIDLHKEDYKVIASEGKHAETG